jgi:WD40 repeat protein
MARIWDAATGRQRATVSLVGNDNWVAAVAIASDGAWLATASTDGSLRIWDAANSDIVAVMRVESTLSSCAWSPSGHLLAAAGNAGIYLFTFNT